MRALSQGMRFSRYPGIVVLLVVVTGLCCGVHAETIEDFDGDSLILAWWGSDSEEPYAYNLDFGSTQPDPVQQSQQQHPIPCSMHVSIPLES